MDYLRLLNGLARRIKPEHSAFRDAVTLDEQLADTGLDSLDAVLLAVYVCETFAIPEEVGKTLNARTFADIARFVEAHKVRTPSSVEEALGAFD